MNLSLCAVVCSIAVLCLANTLASEPANSKKSNSKNPLKDDIPIDDEDGSGFGESRYDLESSGSGYGPDDEDADHGSGPFKINTKSRGQGVDVTIPIPSSSTTTVSSTSVSVPTPISEPPSIPDDNLRSIPVDRSPDENKSLHNNNFNPVEIENRATTPKKSIDDEIIIDNRHPDDKNVDDNKSDSSGVYKVNTPDRDRATSFFAQPGILAAVIGGAVVGLLCAILIVMFIVYRMRKKDEGSYPLEEMKRCPAYNPYIKPTHREFFA